MTGGSSVTINVLALQYDACARRREANYTHMIVHSRSCIEEKAERMTAHIDIAGLYQMHD